MKKSKADEAFRKNMDQKLLQSWVQCIEFKRNDIKFCLERKDKQMAQFHREVLEKMIQKYEQLKIEINGS